MAVPGAVTITGAGSTQGDPPEWAVADDENWASINLPFADPVNKATATFGAEAVSGNLTLKVYYQITSVG